MNLIKKIKGLKLAALLLAAMTCVMAGAENRVYVKPFNIVDETPVVVPVFMDNDVDINSISFRIDLPDELELVGEPERTDRLTNSQVILFRGVAVAVNTYEAPVVGNSGAIMTLKVKVKDGMLTNKAVTFGLSKISMGDVNNKVVNTQKSMTADVMLGEQPEYVFSGSAPEAVISAGETFPVEVCLSNNFAMGGMQFVVKMPAGFDIVNTDITHSNRLSLGTRLLKFKQPDGSLKYVVSDISSVNIADAGEGPLFILYVKAADNYSDYEGKITVSNVEVSTVPDGSGHTVSVDANGFEVKVINGGRYLADAEAVVAGLRSDLAAALTTIASEAADVKDNFTGADITAAIDAIETAAREAAASKTLQTVYESVVTEPAAAVSASIEQLVADAKAAQKAFEDEVARKAANDAAYQASLTEIQRLTDKLNEMRQTAAASYPDATVDTQVAAAQAALDKAKAEADAARAAVADEGNYSYAVDTAAIEALIKAVGDEAAKQQAAADAEKARVAANEAAHNAVLDEIAALQASLDATKAAAAESYPDADVDKQVAAAQAAIDKAKTEAAAAKAAVKDEGNYSYAVDKATIEALITAVTNEAAKQQAAKDAEAKRVADNEAAYKASIDEIAALQAALDAMKTKVAATYPDADVKAEILAAKSAIDKAEAGANAAKSSVILAGNYNYVVDKAGIEALIKAVGDEAARQQAATDAEKARVAANEAAHKAVLDEIAALQASLDATKASAAESYPDADVDKHVAAAQAAIDKARTEAEAAKAAVKDEGNYAYAVDKDGIEALIAAVTSEAAKDQAAKDAEAKRVADNEAAYKASIDEIAALQAALDAMKTKVAATYPDADVKAEILAAQSAIDKAEAGAAAAKSAVILAGNYSYTVDTEGITALINAIETAAEAQRTAANEAAYQATLAEIQHLTDKLDNMKALIATTYPDVNVDEAIAAAAAAIEAAKNGAADALAAVKDEGKYSYTVDAAAIEALIDAIRTAAAEAQAALDKENARVEANQAAYEEAIAQIDALQAALDAMKANVEENYPDADVTAEIEAAQAAIDNARSEAEDALEAVAEEGTFAYSPDTDSVDALIAAIETAAKAAGIVNIEADAAKGILYYDINGRRVINPERGMVVIRLTPDGQVTKIIL
ncbi:unknown [Prevotella sp. CAG:1031]|nr:unknown [Prevotella sp. CAG:1031]